MSFYDDLDIGKADLKIKPDGSGRVIKGDDCQYIKLNSLVNNTGCQSGQYKTPPLIICHLKFRGKIRNQEKNRN